ncbi:MAG: phosphoribosylglycinamide formyltransferase, partial [Thermoleophilia bacterium]|nr:phosphoribosylglycinamide formyltransferase [Thermoleophilia bacterium]
MTDGGGIGVLVTGAGSNLQALIDAGVPIAAVASNVAGVIALRRAASVGAPTAVFALDAYSDRDSRDAAMANWLAAHDVGLVVCAGYMHLLRPVFLSRFPGRVVELDPGGRPCIPRAHPRPAARGAG